MAVAIQRVSCPACRQMIELPDTARADDTVTCCGRAWRLTYAWGTFAAEPPD